MNWESLTWENLYRCQFVQSRRNITAPNTCVPSRFVQITKNLWCLSNTQSHLGSIRHDIMGKLEWPTEVGPWDWEYGILSTLLLCELLNAKSFTASFSVSPHLQAQDGTDKTYPMWKGITSSICVFKFKTLPHALPIGKILPSTCQTAKRRQSTDLPLAFSVNFLWRFDPQFHRIPYTSGKVLSKLLWPPADVQFTSE